MLRPPDSSQSARLQGGNARRRGPFEKKIWVYATVQGPVDVRNDVFFPARAAATFIKADDVRDGWAEHDFRLYDEPDASFRLSSETAAKLIRFYSNHCACERQLVPCPSLFRPAGALRKNTQDYFYFFEYFILFLPDGGTQSSQLPQRRVCVRERNSSGKRK